MNPVFRGKNTPILRFKARSGGRRVSGTGKRPWGVQFLALLRRSFRFQSPITPIKAMPVPKRSQVEGSGVVEGGWEADTNEKVTSPLPAFSPDRATVSERATEAR